MQPYYFDLMHDILAKNKIEAHKIWMKASRLVLIDGKLYKKIYVWAIIALFN